jgi:glycosyltransferase involved in cell wall biosynthesis
MKKIIFILPTLNGHGAERVLINYIRQLDPEKYCIILIVFDFTNDLKHIVPSYIKLIDLNTKRIRRSFVSLYKELRNLKPDIVFTTHFSVAILLLQIKLLLPKFYHIARMPNMPSLEKKYSISNGITRSLYAAGFKSANMVIAQTEDMKIDALSMFKLHEEQVIVQHNPIDTVYIDTMIQDSVSPFPENKFIAVASGRLAFQKGFDILINAIPVVIERYSDFRLYILGSDDGEGKKLKDLTQYLRLDKYIVFQGFIENPYLYYQYCDLFILSSRWEGFPNTLIENYYLNTPIVATKCIPIIEEMIVNGKNGFLCEVDNQESLSEAIINTLKIKRKNIENPPYQGGNIIDIIEAIP